MQFVNVFSVLALLAIGMASGESIQSSLRAKIAESMEASLEVSARGVENCQNKCDKAFNRFAYLVATSGNQPTFEFQACVKGCEQCTSDLLADGVGDDNCFRFCKNYDWTGHGILKGVIEPDKACMGGCIIQTCQVICAGGTTEQKTPANSQFFWPNGGCSIKTEKYSQNLNYVPFNSPNTGQGGSNDVAKCCANALSLCEYVGAKNSANYQQLLQNTIGFCKPFVPNANSSVAICEYFSTPRNCGNLP